MTVYVVSYDLRAPKRDYQPLYERLAAWRAVRALESVWLIEAESSALQVGVDLRNHIDKDDGLLVTPVSGRTAWSAIEPEAAEFLRNRVG